MVKWCLFASSFSSYLLRFSEPLPFFWFCFSLWHVMSIRWYNILSPTQGTPYLGGELSHLVLWTNRILVRVFGVQRNYFTSLKRLHVWQGFNTSESKTKSDRTWAGKRCWETWKLVSVQFSLRRVFFMGVLELLSLILIQCPVYFTFISKSAFSYHLVRPH